MTNGKHSVVASLLGHSRMTGVKGPTNKYADGRVQNLGRARESMLPIAPPATDLLAFKPGPDEPVQLTEAPLDPGTGLWRLLDLGNSTCQAESEPAAPGVSLDTMAQFAQSRIQMWSGIRSQSSTRGRGYLEIRSKSSSIRLARTQQPEQSRRAGGEVRRWIDRER
jgi:hypothetical protein